MALLPLSQVATHYASRYRSQLAACEAEFRCDSFYQVWPFCR
ncbi:MULTISPECIES: hypothetical protein [Halomonas]|nr:hypothetical protein [Halomonas sp. SYSU XM8]